MPGAQFRHLHVPGANSGIELKADLVLLAMGFVGPRGERDAREARGEMTDRGNVCLTSVTAVVKAGPTFELLAQNLRRRVGYTWSDAVPAEPNDRYLIGPCRSQ